MTTQATSSRARPRPWKRLSCSSRPVSPHVLLRRTGKRRRRCRRVAVLPARTGPTTHGRQRPGRQVTPDGRVRAAGDPGTARRAPGRTFSRQVSKRRWSFALCRRELPQGGPPRGAQSRVPGLPHVTAAWQDAFSPAKVPGSTTPGIYFSPTPKATSSGHRSGPGIREIHARSQIKHSLLAELSIWVRVTHAGPSR